jgi:spore cortex biosynthesis protein YabQ
MNKAISVELRFFLISVLWGCIVLAAYDALRVLRRLIKHNSIIIAIEDLIFWISASFFIFSMIYRMNNGSIRGFSIMGMCAGMLLYHYILSEAVVKYVTMVLHLIIRPLRLLTRLVRRRLAAALRMAGRAVKYLLRRLKKPVQWFKISLRKVGKKAPDKVDRCLM